MTKNGLFIVSIGLILFVYNANAQTGEYNMLNLLSAGILIVAGSIVTYMGIKKEKKINKEKEEMK